MFTRGISAPTQSNLAALKKVKFVDKYYLAGGTALSLHLGHRFSNDLDFFSLTPEDPLAIRNQLINIGKLEIEQNEEGTFNGSLNKVKLSFFIYPYPLIYPAHNYEGIKIADILDIACMKIDAISSRGKKRDFIDLYFICQKIKPLDELFTIFAKKYKKTKFNTFHILKSLAYFEDAEKEKAPIMIEKIDWEEVKKFFEKEAVRLGKKYLIK